MQLVAEALRFLCQLPFLDEVECDRLGFTYATPGCVPCSNISFIGDYWADEEEEKRSQSCKLFEMTRHIVRFKTWLVFPKTIRAYFGRIKSAQVQPARHEINPTYM